MALMRPLAASASVSVRASAYAGWRTTLNGDALTLSQITKKGFGDEYRGWRVRKLVRWMGSRFVGGSRQVSRSPTVDASRTSSRISLPALSRSLHRRFRWNVTTHLPQRRWGRNAGTDVVLSRRWQAGCYLTIEDIA